ncbi:Phage-like element PBSX protein XkdM [compost metagenome]
MKNGKDTSFDVQIVNEDPSSSIGTQTVVLKNVNLNSVIMAKLDTESEALEEDIEFTFDDIEILDSFVTPTLN